jgi:hypothetical protein
MGENMIVYLSTSTVHSVIFPTISGVAQPTSNIYTPHPLRHFVRTGLHGFLATDADDDLVAVLLTAAAEYTQCAWAGWSRQLRSFASMTNVHSQ